jgi:hypothetical protein
MIYWLRTFFTPLTLKPESSSDYLKVYIHIFIYNIPKYFIGNLVMNIPIPIMSYLCSMCIVLIHPNFCVKVLIDK